MASGAAEFEKLFEFRMAAGAFAADWSHCDRISSYVADLVSHGQADTLRYSNLFSSVLNELLETVFRNHIAKGAVVCAVSRASSLDRIELTIPCDAAARAFYGAAIADACKPDAAERYLKSMLAAAGGNGLMELAVDYRARFSLRDGAPGELHLATEFVLEE